MSLSFSLPEKIVIRPNIVVFGVGGAGNNAINNMIRSQLAGAHFIAANTDSQALEQSLATTHIQLGEELTKGLGAGAKPAIGKAAAEEAAEDIKRYLETANMVFITAGMGGGTGTGAAPVIAKLAKEMNILTVAVVTKPFNFEGSHRMKLAEQGLAELREYVDTIIIIPNQNLFRVANATTTFADAFKMADDVLHAGVRGVTDLITMPGLINLDFADIVTIMSNMGQAMMGTGESSGENRAIRAAEAAISNPLLDMASMRGAKGVLINITGGPDMTLFEVDQAANRVRHEVDEHANIIFGSAFDDAMEGRIRVAVVATGIAEGAAAKAAPLIQHSTAFSASAARSDPSAILSDPSTPSLFDQAVPVPADSAMRPVDIVEHTAPRAAAQQNDPAHDHSRATPQEDGEASAVSAEAPAIEATDDASDALRHKGWHTVPTPMNRWYSQLSSPSLMRRPS